MDNRSIPAAKRIPTLPNDVECVRPAPEGSRFPGRTALARLARGSALRVTVGHRMPAPSRIPVTVERVPAVAARPLPHVGTWVDNSPARAEGVDAWLPPVPARVIVRYDGGEMTLEDGERAESVIARLASSVTPYAPTQATPQDPGPDWRRWINEGLAPCSPVTPSTAPVPRLLAWRARMWLAGKHVPCAMRRAA